MKSRTARLTSSAIACIAWGVAGYFLYTTEQHISGRRQNLRTFDQHAREAASALADVRAAQQAYVAPGQGMAFWMPKVAALQQEVTQGVDTLREEAFSPDARASLMEAAASVTEFRNVDRRARDYLRAGQTLMAGDVVFTEGRDTAGTAAQLIESARVAEHQAFDAAEAGLRNREITALGAAVGFGVFVMALLALASPGRPAQKAAAPSREGRDTTVKLRGAELMLREIEPRQASDSRPSAVASEMLPQGSLLRAAAEICTEFGRVKDPADLPRLLARAGEVMSASGLVVWLGNAAGADLRPVLAYGYSEHVLARMPNVPRSADNAAATAYRTGKLQIVLRGSDGSNGAVAAPLLGAEGCVGALTAEVLAGSESTDGVQALAALVAAQLTGVLAGSATATPVEASANRIALA